MMKQKKIIVPILTLAVMLLMVGGVYAVFSSTQPEKSKAENVRDTTDQDYEKGLTEEQKAFNELINKQIYEETANILSLPRQRWLSGAARVLDTGELPEKRGNAAGGRLRHD